MNCDKISFTGQEFPVVTDNYKKVFSAQTAYQITSLLEGVINRGTGKKLKKLNLNMAGKPGTTNKNTDAWFIGFTPHIVAGVWVGIDDPRLRLWPRQAGSAAALPLWAQFMKEVYDEVEPYKSMTREEFEYPEKLIERLAICTDLHKLATRFCPNQSEDIIQTDQSHQLRLNRRHH